MCFGPSGLFCAVCEVIVFLFSFVASRVIRLSQAFTTGENTFFVLQMRTHFLLWRHEGSDYRRLLGELSVCHVSQSVCACVCEAAHMRLSHAAC